MFKIAPAVLAEIRAALGEREKLEREFQVDQVSASGQVHPSFGKLLSIRRRPG